MQLKTYTVRMLMLSIFIFTLFSNSTAKSTKQIFYYYKGEKVYYSSSNDRLIAGIAAGVSFNEIKNKVAAAIAIPVDSLVETQPGKQFLIKIGVGATQDITPIIEKLKQVKEV